MRRLYQFLATPAMLARAARRIKERIENSDRSGTDGTASLYPFWGIRKAGPASQEFW
jgi:hypothetical protein